MTVAARVQRVLRDVAASAALGVALAGCATHGVAPTQPLPGVLESSGAWPAFWQASGRLAVKDSANGFSARFVWFETPVSSVIDVHGPLGLGAVHVTRDDRHIVIESARDTLSVEAPFDSLEDALAQRLGAPLPLGPLRYWLVGRPDPDGPFDVGAPGQFVQYGWSVAATRPAAAGAGVRPLPTEIEVTRPPTRIRVLIDEWRGVRIADGAP